MKRSIMLRLVLLLTSVVFVKAQDVFVTVENGVLRGTTNTTFNGTPYHKYLGIPYAQPPVGELRFQATQPFANWSAVRDATTEGARCIQFGDIGSEDCLFLNVFVPESIANSSTPGPVMLFIHGGGFYMGSGSTLNNSPDRLLDHGVIFVSINYRLGPIGFVSLLNDDIPGNAGLKDQVFALQWVQRNIAAFNGDPDKVTIFGNSAGGCSTNFLLLSPAAQGLFSGAIMMSGEMVTSFAIDDEPRERTFRLAANLGLQSDNETEVAEFLLAVDASELTRNPIIGGLSDFEQRMVVEFSFVPVVETASSTAVLTELPATLLKEGRFNQVPVLGGIASADGSLGSSLILQVPSTVADYTANFTLLVAPQLPLPTEEQRTEAASQIEQFYFGEQGFSTEDMQTVVDWLTDMYFGYAAEFVTSALANTSSLPVFQYYWDFNGTGSIEYGMPHGSESSYLFGTDVDPDSPEGQATERLVTLWTNFAKYGEPAPEGIPVTWERYTTEQRNYLDMKAEFVNRQDLLKERMDFWKEFVPM